MSSPTFAKFEALLKGVPASTYGFKVDAGANTYVPTSDYYLSSIAPTFSASLLSAVTTLLVAYVAASTCVLNSDGTVTITFGSGTHTLTWASTILRDLLGFSGTLTPAATTFTSTKQATPLWIPNAYQSEHLGSVNSLGGREDDTVAPRAQSGVVTKTSYNTYVKQRFAFVGLTKEKVWTEDETAPLNGSFESFWANHLTAGGSGVFRHYTNKADDTSYQTPVSSAKRDYTYDGWEPPERFGKADAKWSVRFNGKILVAE